MFSWIWVKLIFGIIFAVVIVQADSELNNIKNTLFNIEKKQLKKSFTFEAYSLTGRNKPNGIIYRLREQKAKNIPDYLNSDKYDIVDYDGNGWVALERENKIVSFYNKQNKLFWTVNLHNFTKENKFEIQDIRYENDILYFNAACQSYSFMNDGKCSSLYAINPKLKKIKWNTNYLISNSIFIIKDDMIISGYGFTDEKDYLYAINKKNGQILEKVKLDTAHEYLEFKGNKLYVITYKSLYTISLKSKQNHILNIEKEPKKLLK